MPHVILGYSLYLGPFHSHQSWSLGNFAIHSEFGSLEIQDLIWSSLKTPDSPPWIMNRDERKKCKNLGRPLANRRGPSAASTTGRLQWSKLPWWKLASVLMAGRAPFVPFVPICHDWRFQLRWAVLWRNPKLWWETNDSRSPDPKVVPVLKVLILDGH